MMIVVKVVKEKRSLFQIIFGLGGIKGLTKNDFEIISEQKKIIDTEYFKLGKYAIK